ncbi:MAG: hypothetical protein E7010_03500 [Alphaproteobacteria bacterium]|nr:hypothetical protein [Alphaproteobacteria bacterium]
MSQNLIEKIQEVWNVVQKDRNVRNIVKSWKKIRKTDQYRVVSAVAKSILEDLEQSSKKILNKGRYALIAIASFISGPSSAISGNATPHSNENNISTNTVKETHLSPIMKQLQEVHSEETLTQICNQLLSNDTLYNKMCAERSELLGNEILRVAHEIQSEIGGNKGQIRSRILKKRWGRDVPVGLHCLRSALEVTTEAAQNIEAPEFIDSFIQKIRDYNPNGYYGFHDVFYKHPNYKKSTRTHTLPQIIAEETKDSPHDVILIAHRSYGNRTGSGYHMVLCFDDTVISFNNESIQPVDEYFRTKSYNQGDLINISRTVREDGREEIIKNMTQQIIQDIHSGNTERIDTLLADYMGNKEIPLKDRIIVGSIMQNHLPIISEQPTITKNLEKLRNVRAKMPRPTEISKNNKNSLPDKKIGNNNLATNFTVGGRKRQNNTSHS